MNVWTSDTTKAEYEAIRAGIAVLPRSNAAALSVRGADRADFLHRMTTNDINGLLPGQATVTVLTSPTARILYVFTVLCRSEDLVLLPAAGQSDALASHLRSQIFFMDQVEIHVEPHDRWRVVGPQAMTSLEALGYLPAHAADGHWWESDDLLFVCQDRYDIPGYEVIAPAKAGERLLADLVSRQAVLLSDNAAFEVRRIELGRPAREHELTEEYNPLEVGLAWACSGSKGCYTGQEIIARQITYDKVTKSLVGLRCAGNVAAGNSVRAEGRTAGRITSATFSPTLDQHIALAVIQRPHNTANTLVSVVSDSDEETDAQVVDLPFCA